MDSYNNLKKILSNKWELVTMQAEEQLKVAKDRKKDDKHIVESQEKAYWRVYRPPPGYTTVVESSPVPTREDRVKARSKTKENRLEEVSLLLKFNYPYQNGLTGVIQTSSRLYDRNRFFTHFN